MTLTLPCPQTAAHGFEASSEPPAATPADLRSAAAFHAAVAHVQAVGWNNPGGRALLDALAVTCQRVTDRVEASAHLTHDRSRADDLLSHAWELINTNPDVVLSALNPWAYLTTCLRHTLTNALIADSLQVSAVAVRNGTASRERLRPPVRAGDRWTELEPNVDGDLPLRSPTDRHWDIGLTRLHQQLVRRGASSTVTATAIDRITEIITEARRGRRETAVGTDPELADLGLTPAQSRALLGLLVGARTDQGQSSLWLGLRADVDMSVDRHETRRTERRAQTYLRPFVDEAAA
jgi:hypothetical protein